MMRNNTQQSFINAQTDIIVIYVYFENAFHTNIVYILHLFTALDWCMNVKMQIVHIITIQKWSLTRTDHLNKGTSRLYSYFLISQGILFSTSNRYDWKQIWGKRILWWHYANHNNSIMLGLRRYEGHSRTI